MVCPVTDRSPSAALLVAATAPRLLVCLDFDGTLAPIVEDPSRAAPVAGAVPVLVRLAALPDTWVAVISGRSRRDLVDLVGAAPGVIFVGGHGAEWAGEPAPARPLVARIAQECRRLAGDVRGATVEEKAVSVAVHVRACEPEQGARLLRDVAAGPGTIAGVRMLPGHQVLDLLVGVAEKGTALQRLVDATHPTSSVVVGDDLTDETMFAASAPHDVTVHVGGGASLARYRLEGPSDVEAALRLVLGRRSLGD